MRRRYTLPVLHPVLSLLYFTSPAILSLTSKCIRWMPSGGSGSLFVAAGVGAYDGNLAIYRYNRNNWPEQVCTEYVSLPIIYLAFKALDDKQEFESRGFNMEAIGKECQKTTIPVVTKCHENRAGQ